MSVETSTEKVESSTENLATTNEADDNNGGGQKNFSNQRRGGPPRFGNRRMNQNDHFDDKKPRFNRGPNQGPRGPNQGPRGPNQGNRGPNQGNRGPNQQGPRGSNQQGGPALAERIMYEKLNEMCGPTFELPIFENKEKKFSGRSRLYIGNIPNDVEENEVIDLFKSFGETSELFINKEKNFGFIKIDYIFNAEKAKNELNGKLLRGRNLKIRFAPNSAKIKVKNLDEFVTNELLYMAFSIFGEIDRCVVVVDERGKSVGEGIVEFARKNSALLAIRKCNESCFFLTSSVRPVFVEPHEGLDEMDGLTEKFLPKKNPEFFKHRNVGPRFAPPESFEHEYGMRWKQLNELYTQKLQALKKENEIEQEKLMAQMEYARYEHETAMLREQLRAREMDMGRQKREWEIKEQQAEEARRRSEEQMRRQQEEMERRMLDQEEEMRRRQQENTLFLQAQQLDNMLDNQEKSFDQRDTHFNESNEDGNAASAKPEPKTFLNNYDRNRYEGRDMGQPGMRGGQMGGRGHWGNDNRDFPNKRRRY